MLRPYMPYLCILLLACTSGKRSSVWEDNDVTYRLPAAATSCMDDAPGC